MNSQTNTLVTSASREHLRRSCKQLPRVRISIPISREHLRRNCKLPPGIFAPKKVEPISRQHLHRLCKQSVGHIIMETPQKSESIASSSNESNACENIRFEFEDESDDIDLAYWKRFRRNMIRKIRRSLHC